MTLEVGAKLLAEGVRSEYINEQVYGFQPLKRLKLQQRLISSITVEAQGKIAIGFLTSEDLASSIKEALIYTDILGSDHCPVGLEIEV